MWCNKVTNGHRSCPFGQSLFICIKDEQPSENLSQLLKYTWIFGPIVLLGDSML